MQHLLNSSLLQGGKYRIKKVLGQGGFGITYQATQVALNRKVAIKEFFMKEYCNRDEETSRVSIGSEGSKELVEKFRAKFIKEAQNIAGLSHPHIIRIHDIFEENGTAYYVMEHIGNGSLADYVKSSGQLDEAEALHYIRQIADALEYIHERSMNHLDIKPSNILLDEKRNAVLIDFGLSKRYDEEGNQTSTTPVGISHGYAPIEQYKKGGVGTFSPATDIYSLGATLYKLLTGNTPPDATDLMDDELPTLPSHISTGTASAIAKSMQAGRKSRPQSIAEFLTLLGNENSATNSQSYQTKEETEETTVLVDSESSSQEQEEQPSPNKSNFINGHEFVDLGLSVKWATCNIGAEKPEDYGDYFAWGETEPKKVYSEDTYKHCTKGWLFNKYKDIGENISGTEYDAARTNWGGSWRMPTNMEIHDLIDKCKWDWITNDNNNGYKIIGPNGNSIFLPAAGFRYGTLLGDVGIEGCYCSSILYKDIITHNACNLNFDRDSPIVNWILRTNGQSIRPVSD